MTEIRKWIHLFGLACLVIALARGDKVLITTPHVTSSSEGKCNCPEVLSVELTLPESDEGWTIPLKKDSILKTERTVLFMSETQQNVVEEFTLTSEEHSGIETYHNHEHGAAFIAKCVHRGTETRYLLLEGSVFINSNKFRITPSPSWSMNLQVFPSHVTANYNMTYIEEFHARDSKAILASSSSYLEMMATRRQTSERHKRAVTLPATYYLDILVVVDSYFYDSFYSSSGGDRNLTANKVQDYLAILFSSVAMRQDTLQLENRTLKIRLTKPVILTNFSQNPYNSSHLKNTNTKSSIDAKTLLDLFSHWLVKTSNLGAYDHAMFITSLDIEGGSDSGIKFNVTKGLAYVGTFCKDNGNSSSIISDNGAYQSEGVAAHEITHSLGSEHDGVKNNCSSADRYIMSDSSYAETDANKLNPWKYSACSSQYVLNLLKDLEKNATILQTCLKDSHGNDVSVNTPTISATEQCKLAYGNGSSVCVGGSVPSLDNICDEFYCRIPGTSTCERFIAATGTCCAAQKKCFQGQCVDAKLGECAGECTFGDQEGIVVDQLTCAQLPSSYCYNDEIKIRCCDFCAKKKTSIEGCLYGNKQQNCESQNCGTYFASGEFANLPYKSACCETCNSPCVDEMDLEFSSGQKYSCNDYIVEMDNKLVCNQKPVLEICCKSCEAARDATNAACPWGDRTNCSSLIRRPRPYKCSANEVQSCCHTCSIVGDTTTTTTITTRTTTAAKPTTTTSKISTTTAPTTTSKISTTTAPSTTSKISTTTTPTTTSKISTTMAPTTTSKISTTTPTTTSKLSTTTTPTTASKISTTTAPTTTSKISTTTTPTTTSKISTTTARTSPPTTTSATTSTSTKRAITNANSTAQEAPSTGVTRTIIPAPCWNVIMCRATTNIISPSVLGFLGAVNICLVKGLLG